MGQGFPCEDFNPAFHILIQQKHQITIKQWRKTNQQGGSQTWGPKWPKVTSQCVALMNGVASVGTFVQ